MRALTALCLGVLGYTHVGYPALIGLLARASRGRRARAARARSRQLYEPHVSVCIAAHNEEQSIDRKLLSLLRQDYPRSKIEILVYSDGSTDSTNELVELFAVMNPQVRLIRSETCAGKPTALNRLAAEAQGEILVITDARQPLAAHAVSALVERLADPEVGCVTGNLVLQGGAGSGVYWKYENWIRRQESRFRSVVGMTGPLGALRKADFTPMPADLILDDVWLPMQLRLRGRKVLLSEEAIAYDQAFADRREFGRKVRTLAGNYQIFARMPRLLAPWSNPSWFETMSHKVMRLLSPWALAGLFVSTAASLREGAGHGVGASIERALFAGQVLLYAGAALGPRAGRACGLARTFVVMHAAAVAGLWRFLRRSQPVTWHLPPMHPVSGPTQRTAAVAA